MAPRRPTSVRGTRSDPSEALCHLALWHVGYPSHDTLVPWEVCPHLCEFIITVEGASESFVDQVTHRRDNASILEGDLSVTVLALLRPESQS